MGNSDPFLTYLKSFGYSVVRLPRTDIRPLQVFVREDSRLSRLGDLQTILRPGTAVALPHIRENVAAASISGERTRDLSLGVGLTILGSVIGAMGGSRLGLDVGYRSAKTVAFEFTDVLEDRVDLAEVDQYLTDADIAAFSSHAAQLLEADSIYVTTSTIKSRTFLVEARQESGVPVTISVPDIQQMVGASITVSADDTTRSKIAYQGAQPLVFGFQAARLFYEQGRYTAFKPMPPGTGALEARRDEARADYLVTESPFVRLDAR